jgi:diguanylate cyclase (GGDEF)-like protein
MALARKMSAPHPQVKAPIKKEWHGLLEVISEFLEAPVALIRKVDGHNIKVFEKNSSVLNPFQIEDSARCTESGLFCSQVLQTTQRLFVGNAVESRDWLGNSDMELNLISYLGLPLRWPNGDLFGTLCVMDTIPHYYTEKQERLFTQMQDVIETDLLLLEKNLELENLSKNLEYLANTDDLTGIPNRRAFIAESNRELQRKQRMGHAVSLLMMDIDNFKDINDAYGHEVGDEILKLFATSVKATKRVYDIFGRVGGEEFAMLLPESALSSATEQAERIRKKVSDIFFHKHQQTISFTVSIGVYELGKNDTTILPALNKADKVLYAAKKAGKNCVADHVSA